MTDKREIISKLVSRYYKKGAAEQTPDGWLIRCPKHSPDSHPSCRIFNKTGVFHCWVCKSFSPFEGFGLMGVPTSEINEHFGREAASAASINTPQKIKSLDEIEDTISVTNEAYEIVRDDPWPGGWAFRDLPAESLQPGHPMFDLFQPRLVKLGRMVNGKRKLENLPRISLSFPANRSLKVFLRLSSTHEPKIINGTGVVGSTDMIPFGLTEWKFKPSVRALMVVEGPYDQLRMRQHFYDLGIWDKVEVISLLGTQNWEMFFSKFKMHFADQLMESGKLLLLAGDNDDAGDKLTEKALHDIVGAKDLLFPESRVKVFSYAGSDPGKATLASVKESALGFGLL